MTTRFDPLTTIHKGVRALLFDATNEAARVDLASNRAVDDLTERIERMLELLEEHEATEHAELLPIIELVDRRLAETLCLAHEELEAAGQGVERAARRLDLAPPHARGPHIRELRKELDALSVKYLSHLSHEETVASAVLWGAVGDAELRAVHARILARLGDSRILEWQAILEPVLAPSERAGLSDCDRALVRAAKTEVR
jgi:hypothetical protein